MSEFPLRGGFHILHAAPFTFATLSGGFHLLQDLRRTLILAGDFETLAPTPTVFVWDEQWIPSAQRVMTDTGWFVS